MFGLHDYVNIIKIPRLGIEHTSPQYGFHFLSQDDLEVLGPDLYLLTRKVRMKFIANRSGGDDIADGEIYFQRRVDRFILRNNCHPKAAIFILLPNRQDLLNEERYFIVHLDGADL